MARLEQNTPNPTTGEATVPYEVAAGTRHAELVIREGWNGKEVMRHRLDVTSRQTTLRVAHLPAGVYFYTLLVDGVPVRTRRMVAAQSAQ